MRRNSLLFSLFLLLVLPSFLLGNTGIVTDNPPASQRIVMVSSRSQHIATKSLYDKLQLRGRLSFRAFEIAVRGYNHIDQKQRKVLTVIDFSKPSTEPRMFVIDMAQERLLFSTVCSHGKNSGDNYANFFSNRVNSHQSSLGFYLTSETYYGHNGYSLRLDGLEKGYNDQARKRAIVVHGAAYANESFTEQGRLGRSLGCPAVPTRLARPIINAIKDGSVLYIYADIPEYLAHSDLSRTPILEADDLVPVVQPKQYID